MKRKGTGVGEAICILSAYYMYLCLSALLTSKSAMVVMHFPQQHSVRGEQMTYLEVRHLTVEIEAGDVGR